MTDPVLSALIGVGGAVVVAVTSMITQMRTTRTVIRAEHAKIRDQHTLEHGARRRERFEERVHDNVAELVAISEPDGVGLLKHDKAAIVIQRLQLLIDRDRPAQAELNGAINALGMAIDDYRNTQGATARALDAIRGTVIDLARPALLEILEPPQSGELTRP